MIDRPHSSCDTQPLNTYNVAQLHYAFTHNSPKDHAVVAAHSAAIHSAAALDALAFDLASPAILATPQSSDADLDDYAARRMSSSAASDSSLHSSSAKRTFDISPSTSPAPSKRSRPELASLDPPAWPSTQHNDRHSDLVANSGPAANGTSTSSPRVQLPSLASAFSQASIDRRASLPTLLASDSSRLRLPTPLSSSAVQRNSSSPALDSYQFPSQTHSRPHISTDLYSANSATDYSLPNTAISSSSSFSISGSSPSTIGNDHWASHIVRPSSTPSQIPGSLSPGVKYDDTLRHNSLSAHGLYGGVTRISGQNQQHHHHLNSSPSSSDRTGARGSLSGPAIKTEADWAFAGSDFSSSTALGSSSSLPNTANMSNASPAIAVTGSPQRSPQSQQMAPGLSSLVERPARKRGKLPKPVTDFLKDWLHRHSDHPYPSEEEKKALCHATGLSMSQVSNWMINARRRILAPAHRAAQGPTTNNPYNTAAGRQVLDSRRASVAGGEPMSLYYPMSLQNLPDGLSGPASTRQMVGMTRSMSSSHATAGSLSHGHHHGSHGHHPYLDSYGGRMGYGAGSALHPSQHISSGGGGSGTGSGGSYLSLPMSAPPTLSAPAYFGTQQGMYGAQTSGGGRGLGNAGDAGRYTFPDAHAHSVSPQPGSGYNTPH